MSSWRYSFELVSKELELAKKKKKALDDLYTTGRISESTYKYIERELTEAIIDLEAHLKSLVEKMTARAEELEKQIRSLEIFLANLEIHYAAGDIDEESYRNQNNAITLGLEATKQELESIRNSLGKVKPEEKVEAPKPEVVEEKPTKEKVEEPTEVAPEAPSEAPAETAPEAAPEAAPQPTPTPAPTPASVEEVSKPPEPVVSEEKPEEAKESVETSEKTETEEMPSLVVPKEETSASGETATES
ncbi:hypothetical protein DRO55_02505 [Candidatus Bathyarchaeota archaeon]|nr:MAG: hypothetical protein DRO55_02505 [Candidatus Bathyarchaeota archaeon]